MPGMDATGPIGEGPLTGRRLGRCARGLGRTGQGFGRGMGMGRRAGNMSRGLLNRAPAPITPNEEKEILRQDAKELELELTDIKKRLQELEGKDAK